MPLSPVEQEEVTSRALAFRHLCHYPTLALLSSSRRDTEQLERSLQRSPQTAFNTQVLAPTLSHQLLEQSME